MQLPQHCELHLAGFALIESSRESSQPRIDFSYIGIGLVPFQASVNAERSPIAQSRDPLVLVALAAETENILELIHHLFRVHQQNLERNLQQPELQDLDSKDRVMNLFFPRRPLIFA